MDQADFLHSLKSNQIGKTKKVLISTLKTGSRNPHLTSAIKTGHLHTSIYTLKKIPRNRKIINLEHVKRQKTTKP